MTATTTARPGIVRDGIVVSYPVQASSTIKAGYAIAVGSPGAAAGVGGHAKSLVATDYEDHSYVGVAELDRDNSAGAAAALSVPVRIEGAVEYIGSGLAAADVGKPCWLTDNQTVTTTPPANAQGFYAGIIVEVPSSTRALVKIPQRAARATRCASTTWDANTVSKRFFTAAKPIRVLAIKPTVDAAGTDGSAVTGTVGKVASGTAVGSATALHASTIDLKGTANTIQSLTLSTTLTDLILSPGDSLAFVKSGTMTAATGCVTVEYEEL